MMVWYTIGLLVINFIYVINFSWFPYQVGLNLSYFISSVLFYYKFKLSLMIYFSFMFLFFNMVNWIFCPYFESEGGFHVFVILVGLKFSFILFLLSELMFFFSIFWFYFSVSLVPSVELGEMWGPFGLVLINPFGLPFFNTMLLLSSAVFLTWAHNLLLENGSVFNSLFISIFLGFVFLSIQFQEYNMSFFALNDSVFGTVFYFGTGFHGLHVMIGCLGLSLSLWFLKEKKMNMKFHNGFEMAIIYWHFVDVVWLFLYVFVYWWVY